MNAGRTANALLSSAIVGTGLFVLAFYPAQYMCDTLVQVFWPCSVPTIAAVGMVAFRVLMAAILLVWAVLSLPVGNSCTTKQPYAPDERR